MRIASVTKRDHTYTSATSHSVLKPKIFFNTNLSLVFVELKFANGNMERLSSIKKMLPPFSPYSQICSLKNHFSLLTTTRKDVENIGIIDVFEKRNSHFFCASPVSPHIMTKYTVQYIFSLQGII